MKKPMILAAWLLPLKACEAFVYPSSQTAKIALPARTQSVLFAADEYSALVEAYQKKAQTAAAAVSPPNIIDPQIIVDTPVVEQAVAPAVKETVISNMVQSSSSYVKPTMDPAVKAPILIDYLKIAGQPDAPKPTDMETLVNAKEKLQLLRDNLVQLANEAKAMMAAGVADSSDALHFQENASWYIAGLACLLALFQRNAGRQDASRDFLQQLEAAELKAFKAQEAAQIASEGAAVAKKLALESNGSVSPESILDSTRLQQLEVELEMVRAELETLRLDNAKLQQLLDAQTEEVVNGAEQAISAPPAVKETMPRDPEEDVRILEIIKDVDQANMNGATTMAPDKKVKATAKKKAAKKASKKVGVAAAVVASETDNPWGSLSESTLKRKTIKDLTEYLSARGVAVQDENGKRVVKAKLVAAVQTL